MSDRVLLLSWEYPPVIEGGLARHVRKLAEALVRRGVAVDVLTRGVGAGAEVEARGGVTVYRVPEPGWPRDLDRFVAWVEQMNEDMLAAGLSLARQEQDLLRPRSTATTGSSRTPHPRSSERLEIPYATTIHATEHGRHQGWVQDQPQAHIHAVER